MKKIASFLLILLSLSSISFLNSCSSRKKTVGSSNSTPPITSAPELVQENDKYINIKLLYATNRSFTGDTFDMYKQYSNRRLEALNYGLFTVSIPRIHQPGVIEDRTLYERIVNKPRDPEKHFVIQKHKPLQKDTFYGTLKSFLGTEQDSSQAFIFIHGYNTSFSDATLRSAQIFYDLNAVGVPILFSWPSQASLFGYYKDKKAVDGTVDIFKNFMKETIQHTKGKKLNIIAHSMGNRLLARALANLPEDFPDVKFNNIIMAAPDVAVKDFERTYFQAITAKSDKLTLYSSAKDKALAVSKYANFFSRRLGRAGKQVYVKLPMETVDVTFVDCKDILGHTCFAYANPVLKDIESLFKGQVDVYKTRDKVDYKRLADLFYFRLKSIDPFSTTTVRNYFE